MSQLDASLRVASPTSIEHSWMFCRSTVKQHSQQRVQKMCARPKLRPPGRERTELRDHLEHGFSVPTSPRKKQSMFEWLGCDATAALLCSKHWTMCLEYRFRVPKPINLLEAEELVSLVRRQVDTGMRSRRVLVAADSCLDERAGKGTFQQPHTQRQPQTVVQTVSVCELRHGQIRQTRPHAVGLSSLGGRRLLCCRAPHPLHISEIPSPAFLGWGLGSPPSPILWIRKSHDFRSELALLCRLLFPVWAGRMSLAPSGRGCADWYLWDEIGSRATARSEMWSSQTARPPGPGPSLCTVHVEYARAIFK